MIGCVTAHMVAVVRWAKIDARGGNKMKKQNADWHPTWHHFGWYTYDWCETDGCEDPTHTAPEEGEERVAAEEQSREQQAQLAATRDSQ